MPRSDYVCILQLQTSHSVPSQIRGPIRFLHYLDLTLLVAPGQSTVKTLEIGYPDTLVFYYAPKDC